MKAEMNLENMKLLGVLEMVEMTGTAKEVFK